MDGGRVTHTDGSTHLSGYDTECLYIFDWGFILFGATFGTITFLVFTAQVFVSTRLIVRNEIDFGDKHGFNEDVGVLVIAEFRFYKVRRYNADTYIPR